MSKLAKRGISLFWAFGAILFAALMGSIWMLSRYSEIQNTLSGEYASGHHRALERASDQGETNAAVASALQSIGGYRTP